MLPGASSISAVSFFLLNVCVNVVVEGLRFKLLSIEGLLLNVDVGVESNLASVMLSLCWVVTYKPG